MERSKLLKDNPENLQTLRSVLKTTGFTPEGVLDTLGVKNSLSIGESDILLLLHRTRKGTPLDTFIRLFLIDVPVGVDALQQAIRPMSSKDWVDMGLIDIEGDSVLAKIKLLPYQDMVVAFDPPRRLLIEEGHDYVMGIGGSSLTLANLTVRRQSMLTLDLGSGCGFHAFLAARHSDRVIAVDRNPRAVKMAAFNARLNNLSNIESLEGDLFAPVEGQKFDLIVSNPPFVISPETRYIYRDSGMEGDRICQKIAHQAPEFLQEGGFCHILGNWIEYANQDWRERLAGWFEGSGCDVWVMRNQTRDAATYAATWIRHTEKHKKENFTQRFDQWMAYYEGESIDAIGGGLITMHRTSEHKNWFRAEDGLDTMFGPCGDQIVRGFDLRDFLENVPDDGELMRTCFRLSPDVRLVQLSRPSNEGWKEVSAEVRHERGFTHHKGTIDPYIEHFLIECDGIRELGVLADKLAVSLSADHGKIKSAVCDIVRNLVERGFLLPPQINT